MAWTAPSTWVAGAILTAAQLNTQLRDNMLAGGPIYATTAARDAAITSPFVGQRAFISGTLVNTQYNGTAWVEVGPIGSWTSYTPTLTQSGAVAKTVGYARYVQMGKIVSVQVILNITGTGTASNAVEVGLPVTASSTSFIGSAYLLDANVNNYVGICQLATTTTVTLYASASGNTPMGITPNFAFANGDQVRVSITYEAA